MPEGNNGRGRVLFSLTDFVFSIVEEEGQWAVSFSVLSARVLITLLLHFPQDLTRVHPFLHAQSEVKSPFFTIRLKKNPYSTDITDASQIPIQYMNTREIVKVETKPDKNAIKEEVLKTGVQIPGANVHQKVQLQILIDKL
jgi:hypothetical protein